MAGLLLALTLEHATLAGELQTRYDRGRSTIVAHDVVLGAVIWRGRPPDRRRHVRKTITVTETQPRWQRPACELAEVITTDLRRGRLDDNDVVHPAYQAAERLVEGTCDADGHRVPQRVCTVTSNLPKLYGSVSLVDVEAL